MDNRFSASRPLKIRGAMLKRWFLACCCCLLSAAFPFATAPGTGAAAQRTPAAAVERPVPPGATSANVIFDDSTGPLDPSITRGPKATPATWFKLPLSPRTSSGVTRTSTGSSSTSGLPDPEVLGFAQSGEVEYGGWQADFKLNLLTTIAYAFVNINGNGSLVENDSGWQGLWSSSATQMIDAAHAAGDRVVVSISDHGNCGSCGNTLLGNPAYIQNFVNSLVYLVASRGIDGVNLDFENASDTTGFTTMVEELRSAMDAQIATSSYLSVDAFGSAYQGGELWNLPALAPYVDAIMPMAYDLNYGNTLPNAPLNPNPAYAYTDVGIVDGYLADGVPAHELILGVPYYGYVYSTTSAAFNAPRGGDNEIGAVTYSGALADFACTSGPPDNLAQNWAPSAASPWAAWWSPPSGDPCGADHGSYRELYYDNAQSLEDKYAFVNQKGLRGIGIWALGYDSGSNDLWNAIAQSFSVSHGPVPQTFVIPSAGDPVTILTPGQGQELVFWRGPSDGHLYEAWYSFVFAHWWGPVDMTATLFGGQGAMASPPRVLFTPGANQQLVFWQGSDAHLWEAWYSPGGQWSVQDLTAARFPGANPMLSPPDVILTPGGGQQLVFYQGYDSQLWEAWYTVASRTWNAADLSTGRLGSVGGLENLGSAPTAITTPGGGQQLVFWQGASDGHLWEAWYSLLTSSWAAQDLSAARLHGQGRLASSPAAMVTPDGGQQLVFWQGSGDDQLWEAWYSLATQTWSIASQNVGGSVASSPVLAVTPGGGQQLVFWQGTNSDVWEAWYTLASSTWGHQDLSAVTGLSGSAATAGPPGVVVLADGEQQAWWQGANQSLWELRFVDGWLAHDWSAP
jgi:spore germination protein YaaH